MFNEIAGETNELRCLLIDRADYFRCVARVALVMEVCEMNETMRVTAVECRDAQRRRLDPARVGAGGGR